MALAAFFALTGQRDPILVPEVSQHEIQVRQGFTGTELLLYGAILDPSGIRAGRDYDIVVVLKGPTQSIKLREKQKIAGVWVNAESSDFRSAPAFFAVASSRPISGDRRRAYRGDLRSSACPTCNCRRSARSIPKEQERFAAGLVDLRQPRGALQAGPEGRDASASRCSTRRASRCLRASRPGPTPPKPSPSTMGGWSLRRSPGSRSASSVSSGSWPCSPKRSRCSTACSRSRFRC